MSASRLPLFFVDDPRFDAHKPPREHPERPERLGAVRRGLLSPLREAGASQLTAREARDQELRAAHTDEHLAGLEELFAKAPCAIDEGDTYVAPGSRVAARLCAGSAAMLAQHALARDACGFVLAGRPPGHHATRNEAMGFCLLNNVAIAAYAALEKGAQRVAIVDWDVHHGNGTQDIFEEDPRVLFISLHESPLYPGTGHAVEVGRGAGKGFTINLPLPSHSGAAEYAHAFRTVVLPALTRFSADLTLVSAGFDAHTRDPLATMQLDARDYGAMTSALLELTTHGVAQRLGILLEGGYDLEALEAGGRAVGQALLGERFPLATDAPQANARAAVEATLAAHRGLGLLS